MRDFTYDIEFDAKFAYLYALNVLTEKYSDSDEASMFSSIYPKYACLYAIKVKKARLCDKLHSDMLFRAIENKYNSINKNFVKAYVDFVTNNQSEELARFNKIWFHYDQTGSTWSEENIKEIKSLVSDDYCCSIVIDHTYDIEGIPKLNECTATNRDNEKVQVSDNLAELLFSEYYDEIEENCRQYDHEDDYEDVYDAPTDDEA
jgi:alanine-alpha-ketoisovalerate/valine-pyruvate aminotransferase